MHQDHLGQMSRFLVYNNLKWHDMEIGTDLMLILTYILVKWLLNWEENVEQDLINCNLGAAN